MRTIKVTGKGNVSVHPDLICVHIFMQGVEKKYPDAVQESTNQANLMKETVKKAGLDPKELKTTNLDVRPSYNEYQDKLGRWKKEFNGFKFTHNANITFPNDNKILGKVMYELANFGYDMTFNITYTISDPESAKQHLLKNAVEDSMRKARILADAANVALGEILEINYSWGEIRFETRPLNAVAKRGAAMEESISRSYDIDIEADDIKASDTVTVIWELK